MKKRPFRLRTRLTLLTTLVIVAVLALSAVLTLVLDARRQRKDFMEDAQLKVAAVATNVRAALAFEDQEFAATALQAFALEPNLADAAVFADDGRLIASYPPDARIAPPADATSGAHFDDTYLHVVVPVELDDEVIGSVHASFSTSPIYARLFAFAGTFLIAVLIAGGVAWLLAWRMHSVVLNPLARLADTMRRVSETSNYDVKLQAARADEIGDLYGSFNEMLAQIRARDRQLEENSALLERKVVERTARLNELNSSLESEIDVRRRTEFEMRKLTSALEQTADSVMVTDDSGVIEYVNRAFEEISGYRASDVLGKTPKLLRSGEHDEDFYKAVWQSLAQGHSVREVFINRRPDNSLYHEEKTITPIRDIGGRVTHFVATGKDISDRIRMEEELRFYAHHDAVTSLPNRVLLTDRIEQAVERARRRSSGFGVLFIDLDGFKAINDDVGHQAGDRVLVEVADRLRHAVRAEDTVARLGGDEFAVVLEDIDEAHVRRVAAKIIHAVAQPLQLFDHDVFVTASIGASMYPKDGSEVQSLIRAADNAMYRAKRLGKNRLQMFALEDSAEESSRLAFEQELHRAFNNDEFEVAFQPQVRLADGAFVGMEALLRWRHPDGRVMGPNLFMKSLEETGLILGVDDWVLRTASRQAAHWLNAGLGPFRIAVNVSVLQFARLDFVAHVRDVLEDSGLPPECLHLEITESVLARDLSRVARVLNELAELGIQIAIDDFGIGYSSLNYLKRLPIHRLKIDKSFVQDLERDESDAKITLAIISLAQSLNLHVIAEGVETQAQADFLLSNGCGEAQGFLYGEAMPTEVFEAWLAARARPEVGV